MIVRQTGAQPVPRLRQIMLGLTSASLLFTTTLTPLAAQAPAPGAPPGAVAAPADSLYSAEQLDAILAPIALYPDQLLTELLMAVAYPDQVADAARWTRVPGNRALRGEALDRALRPIPWDPAVKSLVPFPQVLDMLASHTEWTAQLAYAVATQQAATFDSVQRLRREAWQAGRLRSTNQQVVRMDGDLILIEPAAPAMVYVPVYNPQVVYGAWPYPAFPPYYFPPTYYVPGDVLATGIFFGVGVLVAGALWGWATPRWHDRYFYVDPNRYEFFRHFHRRPPADFGRWDRNQWRPPQRPLPAGQFRPPPPPRPGGEVRPLAPRPGAGPLRPAPIQPSGGEVRPLTPRPGAGPLHPAPAQPSGGEVRPLTPRPGAGPSHPAPAQPSGGQVHPLTPQSGAGQLHPAPAQPDGSQVRPAPQSGGQHGPDQQR